MRPTKRERMSEQKHGFDARTPKRYAQIDWFDTESSWAQTAYQLPEEYEEFLIGFQSKIQDAINCIDIDGKKNGDVLDSLIDSETHIALRKIRLMRLRHKHSLMEIETTKKAHLYRLTEFIALLERETEELKERMKEEQS